MRKEIKYIGFYDLEELNDRRVCTIAAVNKMDYICEAIKHAGFNTHIISPSWLEDDIKEFKFIKKNTKQINSNKRITYCPSFTTKTKIGRIFKIILSLIWLFFWLLKFAKRNEIILVYHVQWLSLPIRLAKRIKGFKLLLEVEEIYANIWKNKFILNYWEKQLIKCADNYIAVSDVLAEILGSKVKAIVYGNYLVPLINADKKELYFQNDKINIVYAGSVDDTKGGAYNAVAIARLLPANYLIHISGPGNDESKNKLKNEIEKINCYLGRVACIYHGVIPESKFAGFLQSSQIALNPQYMGEKFKYLFPSKIIKYLAFNLRIISTKIESIEKSVVNKYIYFSEDESTQSLVNQIMSVDFKTPYNSRDRIEQLHNNFVSTLKNEILK